MAEPTQRPVTGSTGFALFAGRILARFVGPATFPGDASGNKLASLEAQLGSVKEELAERRGSFREEERQYVRSIARGNTVRGWLALVISVVALAVAVLAYFKK